LDVQICSHQLVEDYLLPTLDYMSNRSSNGAWSDHQGFEEYEIDKFKRIVVHRLYFNQKNRPERNEGFDLIKKRAMFYDFVNKMDERHGTDFVQTFPEMEEFYFDCQYYNDLYYEMQAQYRAEGKKA